MGSRSCIFHRTFPERGIKEWWTLYDNMLLDSFTIFILIAMLFIARTWWFGQPWEGDELWSFFFIRLLATFKKTAQIENDISPEYWFEYMDYLCSFTCIPVSIAITRNKNRVQILGYISLSKGLPYPWESSSPTILLPCTAQRQNSILMVTGELLYTSQKLTQVTRPVHIIFYRTLKKA